MLLSLYEPAEDRLERATAALRNTPAPPAPPAPPVPSASELARRAGPPPPTPRPPRPGPGLRLLRRLRISATFATAAAILLAVGLWLNSGSGVALARVVQNFITARALELAYTNYEGDRQIESGKLFVAEGQRERVEFDDGRVIITDHEQDRSLTLLPDEHRAILSEAITSWCDIFSQLRNILLEPAKAVAGKHTLDGQPVRVFRIAHANTTLVSVRPGNDLPLQIEHALSPAVDGNPRRTVLRVLAAGASFDPSRFELRPPPGYTVVEQTGDARIQTARRLRQLGHALLQYAAEHDGTFPDTLTALAPDPNNAGPGRDVGDLASDFVYVRPPNAARPRTILAYERFDSWNGGVHVLFGDGHVEFVANRSEFERLLATTRIQAP